ncbi:MBL fold metallo-hydrolase [Bacillus sp. 1P06AnD]|uniref:MBL fold metallo-hydrolase n=1 Tax=Bacillus sp. 1P06AnD TaxID=3132208 RepID=UPI00399F3BBE
MRKKYQNYDHISSLSSFSETRKWQKERKKKVKDLSVQIPFSQQRDVERINSKHMDFSITWIGHSTFLIQCDGYAILTDPVWAKWMGYEKRSTKPGMAFNELPKIDYVLISHNHYDHLHYGSLRRLKGEITYLVPDGLKKSFLRRGFKNVIQAEWWDSFRIGPLSFTFVPAQHWTRRSLTDTNTSHWGGWMIESSGKTVYFAGDSAYFRGFKEIGGRFDIDYTLMPIGAYEPQWIMGNAHLSPEEAIQAYLDSKGKVMVPMHYGAYRLADDTGPEALELLLKAWKEQQLPEEQLAVMKIGETIWDEKES